MAICPGSPRGASTRIISPEVGFREFCLDLKAREAGEMELRRIGNGAVRVSLTRRN